MLHQTRRLRRTSPGILTARVIKALDQILRPVLELCQRRNIVVVCLSATREVLWTKVGQAAGNW